MKGRVYYDEVFAGIIERNDEGYWFRYDGQYIAGAKAQPISLTMPIRSEPYHSRMLFPFFDGLIPEGWLLDIAMKTWKLNSNDRFLLLLAACQDCIGAVRVVAEEERV